MSEALLLQDLQVDLGAFQLHDFTLTVKAGEYFVILGPTGAGKTVLLETIAGLHPLRRGRMLLGGRDVSRLPPERRGIGFVYQDYVLFPHLNVAENIAFGLRLRRLARDKVERRVTEMSALLKISHLLHRRPDTLSGGERQRVALARALIVEPQLLLMDEPLSALDPETREELIHEIARLHRELGTTTLHVTHDFEEAVTLGDRIAVVDRGHIAQIGTPQEIFRKPASEFVARFVGTRNIYEGEIRHLENGYSKVSVGQVEIAVLSELNGRVHVSIRPEDILLSLEPLRSSARNVFRGHITHIADRGTVIVVTVTVPPDFVCLITRRSLEEMSLHEGREVYIAFKASAVHVF